MNANQLADELTAPLGKSGESTYSVCNKAAAMLRKQDEAIRVLRKSAADALYVLEAWERDCDQTLYWRDHHEAVKDVKAALAATENL